MKKNIIILLSLLTIASVVSAQSAKRPDWAYNPKLINDGKMPSPSASIFFNTQKGPYQTSASVFGKHSVAIGGGMNGTSLDIVDTDIGASAVAELNVNIWRNASDNYGINLSLPLMFNYVPGNASKTNINLYQFEVPVFVRPYYRLNVSKDIVVTAFGNLGIGGLYSEIDIDYLGTVEDDFYFMWGVGGGVEVLFYDKFAFTPRYTYINVENTSYLDYSRHTVGIELAYKFHKNISVACEWQHWFWKDGNGVDLGLVKLRFDF